MAARGNHVGFPREVHCFGSYIVFMLLPLRASLAVSVPAVPTYGMQPPAGPVKNWDVEQVCRYLNSLQLGLLQETFREHEVDGKLLLELSVEDLMSELGLKKLQAKKIMSRFPKDEEVNCEANAVASSAFESIGILEDWNVDQVCEYLGSLKLDLLQTAFRENAVDGRMLLELSVEDLVSDLGLKKLQAKKLMSRLPKGNESNCESRAEASSAIRFMRSLGKFATPACLGVPAMGEEITFVQSFTFVMIQTNGETFRYIVPAKSKAKVVNVAGEDLIVKANGISGGIGNLEIPIKLSKHIPIMWAACAESAAIQNSNWQESDTGRVPDMILSGELWGIRHDAHHDATIAISGVRQDALLRRFVSWNATDLSRGRMDLSLPTPGRDRSFSYQSFYSAQGLVQQSTHRGLPLMKSVWDLQLLSRLILELQPRTIIEIGTGLGGSALWYADELKKLGNDAFVHSFGLPFNGNHKIPEHPRAVFHTGSVHDLERMFPEELLAKLPHPWLVAEDAHQNVQATARLFFKHMHVGDYYVCEDADSHHMPSKRKAWYEWLYECGRRCALDLMYADFFGVNQNWSPDGWIKKIAD